MQGQYSIHLRYDLGYIDLKNNLKMHFVQDIPE